jgi:SAM-dependent methyltransferase
MVNSRYSEYDPFAWLYNKHWGDRFALTALAVIDELVLPRLAPGAEVLDLCCGTGQMAQLLSERGYRITGIDGSENMLFYARENAPETHFILSDARSFTADTTFDAAVCVFDSLNHVMSVNELGEVFMSVSSALKDNGVFLFDMVREPEFMTNWKGYWGIVEDDHVCIIQNRYNPTDLRGVFEATLFRQEEGWQRTDFSLMQTWYPDDEVRQLLEKAGFGTVRAYAYNKQTGLGELAADSRRAFFLCSKSGLEIDRKVHAGQ